MPQTWQGTHGQSNGHAPTYFEGIHIAVITGFQFQCKNSSGIYEPVQNADAYDPDTRLLLELTVGTSQYPNKYTIPGGPAEGSKDHPWSKAMKAAGLDPMVHELWQMQNQHVKALFYATVPNDEGKIYTNVWNIILDPEEPLTH